MGELFERTKPEAPLDWTGERLTTENSGEVETEHLHRYFLARELCRESDVLDIACGEGYGAMLLAQVARSVVGVDVSAEAVAFAEVAYRQPNLRFLQGDARSIPCPDCSLDVVVSFETIEHMYEQEEFLSEVTRVLRPGGRFIVSSPERDVYSPAGGPVNPYHVRELTREEFRGRLESHFAHTSMYGQRSIVGSTLMPEVPLIGVRPLLTFERRDDTHFEASVGLPTPRYLIAIASDAPQDALAGSLYIETSELDGLSRRLTTAEQAREELTEKLDRLSQEHGQLAEAHQGISAANESMRARNEAAQHQLRELALQHHAQTRAHQLEKDRLEADLAALRVQYDNLMASTSWRLTRPLRNLANGRSSLVAPVSGLVHRRTARRASRFIAKVARWTVSRQPANSPARAPDGEPAVERLTNEVGRALISQVQRAVSANATLLVVTRGNDDLLQIFGRRSWPFPQPHSGAHGARNLTDGTAATAHLEALRVLGAEYFVLPGNARRWLESHASFHRHLSRHYRLLTHLPDDGLLFSLLDAPPAAEVPGVRAFDALALHDSEGDEGFALLDWHTNLELAASLPHYTVFAPPDHAQRLPYLDKSIDVVAVRDPEQTISAEARRVARAAVVTFTRRQAETGTLIDTHVEWMPGSAISQLPSASIIIAVSPDESFALSRVAAICDRLPTGFRGEVMVAAAQVAHSARERLSGLRADTMSVRVLNATVQEASLQADAEVLVLVGDGAAPLPDCVPMLLRSLARLPDAAVVGGRVVGRDGGLLEAGGHLAGDGTVRLIGTGYSDPDDPAYGYVREVDWCSRNMLATWRSVWDELGGFDMNYRSSHFQDADYCLRVGHNGGRIYYQPASVVVRVGGDSRPSAEPADRHLFADRFTGGAVRVA